MRTRSQQCPGSGKAPAGSASQAAGNRRKRNSASTRVVESKPRVKHKKFKSNSIHGDHIEMTVIRSAGPGRRDIPENAGTGRGNGPENTGTGRGDSPENAGTKGQLSKNGTDSLVMPPDYINQLSLEILCRVLRWLSLRDVVKLERLSRRLRQAVGMHLQLLTTLDFTEGHIYGWMPHRFTDATFTKFMSRCTEVVNVSGLHPRNVLKRSNAKQSQLSIPGIISALMGCAKLKYVETCDIFLLEGVLFHLPHVGIKRFKNRNGGFPIPPTNRIELTHNPQITHLSLNGVTIPELPRLAYVKCLQLQWVRLSLPHPFRDFSVPNLHTFIMSSCAGPSNALSYVPLVTSLAAAPNLKRLELVRVPFLGGLLQHVVEDNWRMGAFRQLSKIVFGACRHALEVDLGYLTITCAGHLVELDVQPSLTKDSFFASLSMAEPHFPMFETLKLGHVDDFPEHGKWLNEDLVAEGLADSVESPCMITDLGVQSVGKVFPECQALHIYNCPHLHMPLVWFVPGNRSWARLKELHLRRCHAKLLNEFRKVIPQLVGLESLILEQMFREPPKGCSRVGLSAGTGLGVSSALVQNSHNDVANQDLVNNNAPAPAANEQGPLNQPLMNPPHPPPAVDDDDDIHENMEVEVLLEQNPANPFAADAVPANQMAPGDVAGNNNGMAVHFDNVVAAGPANQNLQNEVNNGNAAGPANQNLPNEVNNGNAAGPANHNLPNQVNNGNAAEPANQDEAQGAPPHDLQNPADGDGLEAEVHNDEGTDSEEEVNNIICTCGQRSSGYRAYVVPQGTGKMLASRGKSRGASNSAGGLVSDCQPGCSRQRDRQHDRECGEKGLRRSSRILNKSSRSSEDSAEKSRKDNGKSCKKFLSKSSKFNNQVNQYSQATCEEIRETTKKAKEKEESAHMCVQTRSGRLLGNGPQPGTSRASLPATSSSGCASEPPSKAMPGDPLAKRAVKRKTNMVDKSTSTSDPVIEEDHVQILTICSKSLVNLTLREVGITDLVLHDCPRLQMVNGSSCRVLRDVLIKNAPRLNRISFVQCPKLRNGDLVDDLSAQPAEKNRLVTLRPMCLRPPTSANFTFDRNSQYNPRTLEAELFRSNLCNYHVCIIHDYSTNPEESLHNRLRAMAWPDLMTNINFELIRNYGFKEAEKRSESSRIQHTYPWGRRICRMHGNFGVPHPLDNGSYSTDNSWEIMTDLPWLQPLMSSPAISSKPEVQKPGLYDLNAMGHRDVTGVLKLLSHEIAEAQESGVQLFLSTMLVYVNMCDIGGEAKSDRYV